MRHTRLALQRPVTTIMIALAVLAVGLISTKLLRLEAMPDITFPGMRIVIPFPGSTPEEMELLVVRPVEEAVATLAGIEEIRATAAADQAEFIVLFSWDRDPETAAFEVRTKIDSIRSQLPAAADRVLMFSFSSSDEPVTVIRIASDQDLTDQYDTLEKYLKRPIERLDGVARVELQGVEPRELRVLVDPDRLAAYGVDVQELRLLLERSNFSVSAGQITENGQRFTVRPIGEFQSNKKTNAVGKSDKQACEWAFLSALLSFHQRALSEGGNAVVNIKGYYKKQPFSSQTEFQCGAGATMAGVTIKGTVVKLK